MVNLQVLSGNGNAFPRTSVKLMHCDETYTPTESYCEWMPYQKGQTAKTEEAEKRAPRGRAEWAAHMANETKVYGDGTVATGPAPLPEASPTHDQANTKQLVAKAKGAARVAQPSREFTALESEERPTVDTETAAHYLGRRPQTLRGWACLENGPLLPIRVHGRLAWKTNDIRKLLEVAA
jgi:hypothetical protein